MKKSKKPTTAITTNNAALEERLSGSPSVMFWQPAWTMGEKGIERLRQGRVLWEMLYPEKAAEKRNRRIKKELEITTKIAELKLKFETATEFEERLNARGQIHSLKMALNGVEPYRSIERSYEIYGRDIDF